MTDGKSFISLLFIGGQQEPIEVGTWGGRMRRYGSLDSPLEVTFLLCYQSFHSYFAATFGLRGIMSISASSRSLQKVNEWSLRYD